MFGRLLDIGVENATGERRRQRRIWNGILIFGLLPNPLIALLLLLEQAYLPLLLVIMHMLVLGGALVAKGIKLEKLMAFCLIWSSFYVFVEALLLRADLGVEYVLCIIAYMPLLVLRGSGVRLLMTLFTIPVVLAGIVAIFPVSQIGIVVIDPTVATVIRSAVFVAFASLSGIIIFVFVDESERMRKDYEASQRELARNKRFSDTARLAVGVAHEINNPLAVAMGNLDLVKEHLSASATPQREFIAKRTGTASTALGRVARIVESLRGLSVAARPDEIGDVNLTRIIAAAVAHATGDGANRGTAIHTSGAGHDLVVPFCEEDLRLAVSLLLDHALAAVARCPPDARWIRIAASQHEQVVDLRLSFSRERPAPEQSAEVMLPFAFWDDDAGARSGLGLSRVLSIMKSYGGDLFCDESAPHTAFVVRMQKQCLGHSLVTI